MSWTCLFAKEIAEKKQKNIERYKGVERLTEADIKKYIGQREDIIKKLKAKGVRTMHRGNSLFYGALSPGCSICKTGKSSCVYVTNKCTRNCFYCAKPALTPADEVTIEREIKMESPEALVRFLKKWKIRAAGISGGEPLSTLDKTLKYITAIRKGMGRNFYIWLYSNGDLATVKNLKRLKKSGLNEMMFNLSARAYDLAPLRKAVGIIDVVCVETPAIPEDEEKIKSLLPELKKLGVRHVNLHELMLHPFNLENMKKRQYRVLVGSSKRDFLSAFMPVYGSELSALRIMDFAIENDIGIPINFCSCYYKHNVQGSMLHRNAAEILRRHHERVTESGLLEKLVIDEPRERAEQLVKTLKGRGVSPQKIYFSKELNRFELHPSLLKRIDVKKFRIITVLALPCRIHSDTHDMYTKKLA